MLYSAQVIIFNKNISMLYNWQFSQWPEFQFNIQNVSFNEIEFASLLGEMSGIVSTMNSKEQQNALIKLMISEAVTTSSIEGEVVSRQDVMSSIRNNLGLNYTLEPIKDKKAKRIATLMTKVRDDFAFKLTEESLKSWHKILFEGTYLDNIGEYRNSSEPMQVVSGTYGKEIVHYEAPPSELVEKEMKQFVDWYNNFNSNNEIKLIVVKSAIAHLYFESLHPFEDGNGRIGRALVEKCISESIGKPVLLSISTVIEKDKSMYYNALKEAQKSLLIDNWINYFINLIVDAQKMSIQIIHFTLKKTKFFDKYKEQLNERQTKVINKMFDFGIEEFQGGMSAKKYMSITQTSKATATRDLQFLAELGILSLIGGGRNAKYVMTID